MTYPEFLRDFPRVDLDLPGVEGYMESTGSGLMAGLGETREEMVDSILRCRHYERATSFRHWVCYACQPLPGRTNSTATRLQETKPPSPPGCLRRNAKIHSSPAICSRGCRAN